MQESELFQHLPHLSVCLGFYLEREFGRRRSVLSLRNWIRQSVRKVFFLLSPKRKPFFSSLIPHGENRRKSGEFQISYFRVLLQVSVHGLENHPFSILLKLCKHIIGLVTWIERYKTRTKITTLTCFTKVVNQIILCSSYGQRFCVFPTFFACFSFATICRSLVSHHL